MDNIVTTRMMGVGASMRALRGYSRKQGEAMERGVKKATQYLLNETIKVTPIATGDLRRSGRTQYTGRGKNIRGRVHFTARYAIYVHEDMDKYHAPGTYAKYLSRTVWEKRGQMNRIIWEELNKVRL